MLRKLPEFLYGMHIPGKYSKELRDLIQPFIILLGVVSKTPTETREQGKLLGTFNQIP